MSSEDIKPGYKRTEVGVIPEDWGVAVLGDVCDVRDGTHESPKFMKHGIPFITSKNIVNGFLDLENVSYISKTDAIEFDKRSKVELNDILMSMIGTIGSAVHINFTPNFCIKNVALIKPRKIDPFFLTQLINSSLFQKYLNDNLDGGIQKFIALGTLRQLAVAIPSSSEQRTIATALSDVDALLAQLDQLIVKKRDLKQATMQQLLTGQTRLPGFSGAWQVKRLGDVGNCLRGVTYKGDSDLWPHDTAQTKRLLRSNNVQNSMVVIDDVQFVNFNRVASQQLLRKNDILICMANGSKALVGKAGFFDVADGYEYTFGAFMGCFRTEVSASDPAFVFYLFQTARYRDYINNLLAGSSINNLNPGSINSLEFRMPEMVEQTAIATVLSDIDTELAALEARRNKTRALKQGMMQELLTGRIRLV